MTSPAPQRIPALAPIGRIAAPRPPEPPRPYRFPVIATVAPVVVAVAIFAVTSSPFALVFAALGPVTAVATLIDSRWSGRRLARREAERFAADLEQVRTQVEVAHGVEIATLEERTPGAAVIAERTGGDPYRWKAGTSSGVMVTLGRGRAPSALELERSVPAQTVELVADQLAQLDRDASTLRDAPVVVDASLGIGIAGQTVFTEALARALIVQVAWALPPSLVSIRAFPVRDPDSGGQWISELPHPVVGEPRHDASVVEFVDAEGRPVAVVARSALVSQLPGSCAVVISVAEGTATITQHPDRSLRRPFRPALVSREAAFAWAIRARADASREGFTAEESHLPQAVPLESLLGEPSHSPGAASLACGVAVAARGPFMLDLVAHGPHAVVGGTTGSGKSELLIAWVLAMAYAHPPDAVTFLLIDFKGGSAFGSLAGLAHTVGIITDLDESEATRALESMRAELRFRERTLAEVGARSIDDASALPRLVIIVDEFAAMIADFPDLHALFADIAARGRSLGVHLVLCTQRPAGVVRDGVLANAFALVDLPHEQRRADAVFEPVRDGHVLVLGMQSSGKSHALEALAAPLGVVQRIPANPDRAWDAVLGLIAQLDGVVPMVERGVLIDDVDALVPRLSGDHRPVFVELLCRVLREGGARGVRVMMSAQRLTPELQGAATLAPARLFLRHASRQDLVLAGGEGASFRELPVGGGLWKGERVQVVLRPLPAPDTRPAREHALEHRALAIVTPTPGPIAERLREHYRPLLLAACSPESLLDPPADVALVGDPEEWQSRWGALTSLRGKADVVFSGCSVAEFRALSRSRQLPPPLAPDPLLAWLLHDDGTVGRTRIP